jgi:hypothetical protein
MGKALLYDRKFSKLLTTLTWKAENVPNKLGDPAKIFWAK